MSGPRGVVVTGGTGALGSAVVLALLRAGSRVAIPHRGQASFEALRAAAGRDAPLFGKPAELAELAAAGAFMDEAARFLGVIDGLVAAAGAYAGSGSLEASPIDEWDRMMQVNLTTAQVACRAALPHLLKQGGSVVTVGSKTAETAGAGAAAYAVSKVAVHALTRVLALENRARGVRFNCIAPGTIDTKANRSAMPKADTSAWTSPDAIAAVVLFLLSPESAPVTGTLVPVDAKA